MTDRAVAAFQSLLLDAMIPDVLPCMSTNPDLMFNQYRYDGVLEQWYPHPIPMQCRHSDGLGHDGDHTVSFTKEGETQTVTWKEDGDMMRNPYLKRRSVTDDS